MDVMRTMIVTADDAPLARQIAETIDPAHSTGLWLTPLASADAPTVTTHYVSSGWVSKAFAASIPLAEWVCVISEPGVPGTWERTSYYAGDPAAVVASAAAIDPPLVVTEAQVADMFSRSDVTTQDPWTAFARLGLVLVDVAPVDVAPSDVVGGTTP